MTETTQTQTTPAGGARPRSPEFQLAKDALRGLRQDLFHDAFAYRPLARMRVDGTVTRMLPDRPKERAVWIPHAVVVAAGLLALLISLAGNGGSDLPQLLTGLLSLATILLTLVRPVGAFWVSMAATPVTALFGDSWSDWPWLPGSFATHLVVLTVVALRTRPRTAAWMWAVTAAYGVLAEFFFSGGHYYTNTLPFLFVSALVLLLVTVWHVRHEAARKVTAQQSVTAHERSRRTLLEERTTIARELHDVVAHHMSVVAIQAEAAPYRVENPPPELEYAFAVIRENAVVALSELRRVLGVVRAEDYEAPDAPQPRLADLDRLLENVRDAGLRVDKAVTGAVRELPQGVELSAYRIVQEALSNSLRHAPGAEARVEIGYVLGGLGLRIVNGPATGLAKPSVGAGHGITGMRERVTMLDGEMTSGTTDEGGFEVAVFLPVPAATAPAEERP
ncbi:sensor histidine kinase [Streptomyces fructofermentans]|uniref:histidine kinase n=1 Tax=Streptomyces fructofermentans TaxID=152141 RepID=A0A918KKF4_9ACTN|nr:histidine kinase [Streptomyces fructofermentans]GGX65697.1 two-component sensor histidine kinase [Streptomyces fructofermentans]